jgi:hypothetical protein
MERRALWIVLLALAVGLTTYLLRREKPAPALNGICWGNYGKIQQGMTQPQVEALLGVPPGDYAKALLSVRGSRYLYPGNGERGSRLEEWWSDTGVVRVLFGPDGTVADKEFLDVEENSWFTNLMTRLGL